MADFKLYAFFTNLETAAERDEEGKLIHRFRLVVELYQRGGFQGALVDFFVNGELIGQDQTDEHGTAFVEHEIHTLAQFALGKVKMTEHPFLEKPVRINFPKLEKKSEDYPRLKVTKFVEIVGEKIRVFLTRTDSKGNPLPGKILYFDQPEKEAVDPKKIESPDGTARHDFLMGGKKREVNFYTPERPNDLTPVEIPAKKIAAPPKPPEPPQHQKQPLIDRMREKYHSGRQG
jgi:hypothetical protein